MKTNKKEQSFIVKHREALIGAAIGVVGTAYICYKISRIGDASYPNKMTVWYDKYVPGLDTIKDQAIEGAFAVVEYEDGSVDIVDDILGLAKVIAKRDAVPLFEN